MTRPSLSRMLARGVGRRCPWCGGRGAFFTGWFAKASSCRSCGLRWRRGDVGFELGAAAIAAVVVLGTLIVGLGAVLAFTWPDVPTVPLYVGFGIGAIVLPVVMYPVSYTIWQAIDLAMRPAAPEDFDVEMIGGTDPDGTSSVRSEDA